jgi:DNA-binding MarR family transcriptional regulator
VIEGCATESVVANRILVEIKQTKPFESKRQEAALNIMLTADALKRGLDLLLKRHGITSSQYNVLRILRGAGEPGLHCNGIAERMITAEPDITRLLMRMERLGLLERRRDGIDRRMVTAFATDRGLQALDEVEAPRRELQDRQFALLSDRDLEALIAGLEKVRESMAQPAQLR